MSPSPPSRDARRRARWARMQALAAGERQPTQAEVDDLAHLIDAISIRRAQDEARPGDYCLTCGLPGHQC